MSMLSNGDVMQRWSGITAKVSYECLPQCPNMSPLSETLQWFCITKCVAQRTVCFVIGTSTARVPLVVTFYCTVLLPHLCFVRVLSIVKQLIFGMLPLETLYHASR